MASSISSSLLILQFFQSIRSGMFSTSGWTKASLENNRTSFKLGKYSTESKIIYLSFTWLHLKPYSKSTTSNHSTRLFKQHHTSCSMPMLSQPNFCTISQVKECVELQIRLSASLLYRKVSFEKNCISDDFWNLLQWLFHCFKKLFISFLELL